MPANWSGMLNGPALKIDAIIHFDRIAAGGKYNARRVRYDGRNYYVTIRNVKVWIDGDLLARVLRVVTCVYGVRGQKRKEDENSP